MKSGWLKIYKEIYFEGEVAFMKIGIQTWGSTGDVRPMVALAGGLRARGHDVTLVATCINNMDFTEICRQLDVTYIKAPDIIDYDLTRLMKLARFKNSMRMIKGLMQEVFFPYLDEMSEWSRRLCKDCDVVIGHFLLHFLKALSQKDRVPFISVTFWPGAVPTRFSPPYGLPGFWGLFNNLEWKLVQMCIRFIVGKEINAFWEREGLSPLKNIMPDAWFSDRLNLLAASPMLFSQQPDWGTRHRICGFFNLPVGADPWKMPRPLQEFLDSTDPIVFMTLGSGQLVNPVKNMEMFIDAARAQPYKAIIRTSSANLYPADSINGNIYFIGKAPHERIFPHCAAVVHHAGAGTTHSATRAGCPSVVVAFNDEEMSWGDSLYRLGVAYKPFRHRMITSGKIAKALNAILASPKIRGRARQVGEMMQGENGVNTAVRYIEQIITDRI